MSLPSGYPFANLAAGNQPASLLDAVFAALGNASNINCTVSGTANAIVLTAATNFHAPTAYVNGQVFTFRATANSTAAVTIAVGALAALGLYAADGVSAIGAGIINGSEYAVRYSSAANAGAGGFIWTEGSAAFANGTAAAPSIHGSDASSGFYFQSNFGFFVPSLTIDGQQVLSWRIDYAFPGASIPLMGIIGTTVSQAGFFSAPQVGQSGSCPIALHAFGSTGNEASLALYTAKGVAGTPVTMTAGQYIGLVASGGWSGTTLGYQANGGASQTGIWWLARENFVDNSIASTLMSIKGCAKGTITRLQTSHHTGDGNWIFGPPDTNETNQNEPGQGVHFFRAATAPTSALTYPVTQWWNSGGTQALEAAGNTALAVRPAQTSAGTAQIFATAYGTNNFGQFSGLMARGVNGTPTPTQAGDILAQFDGTGWDATNTFGSISGVAHFVANSNFTAASHETYFEVGVVPSGSLTLKTVFRGLGVATAVNYLTFTNSATTNALAISAVGTDTNIAINIATKGTAPVNLTGTGTNDSAATGIVGEYVSATVSAAASIAAAASGAAKDITSISLTAGDWDVWGTAGFLAAAGTTSTIMAGWISTTSATQPTGPNNGAFTYTNQSFPTAATEAFPTGNIRLSLAVTTTVYVSATATYAVSTMNIFGGIFARRRR